MQNLIAAIEGGSSTPAALLKAVADREATIKALERELRRQESKTPPGRPPDLGGGFDSSWKTSRACSKTTRRAPRRNSSRLNLRLTFEPVAASPRPYYAVKRPVRPVRAGLVRIYVPDGLVRFWTDRWQSPPTLGGMFRVTELAPAA